MGGTSGQKFLVGNSGFHAFLRLLVPVACPAAWKGRWQQSARGTVETLYLRQPMAFLFLVGSGFASGLENGFEMGPGSRWGMLDGELGSLVDLVLLLTATAAY